MFCVDHGPIIYLANIFVHLLARQISINQKFAESTVIPNSESGLLKLEISEAALDNCSYAKHNCYVPTANLELKMQ